MPRLRRVSDRIRIARTPILAVPHHDPTILRCFADGFQIWPSDSCLKFYTCRLENKTALLLYGASIHSFIRVLACEFRSQVTRIACIATVDAAVFKSDSMASKVKSGQTLSPLETKLNRMLANRKSQSKLRQLKSSPPSTVDFSSNDFLSLSTTSAFRDDFLAELQKVTRPVGSTGSRLLDGNSHFAEQLEAEIALFHGAEAGLLTNSGFDANVSIFMCLPQPNDVVIYDELIHASVHDGMRQSRARDFLCFKHNDVDDLREVLQPLSSMTPNQNVFVAVETVYSMEGDVAPLSQIVALTEELFPARNCHIVVDEAHATGVYGDNGRGIVSQLGLESKISVRLQTFGKALACNGG